MTDTSHVDLEILTTSVLVAALLTVPLATAASYQTEGAASSSGACVTANPHAPSVGVNPRCRPVGTPGTPWIKHRLNPAPFPDYLLTYENGSYQASPGNLTHVFDASLPSEDGTGEPLKLSHEPTPSALLAPELDTGQEGSAQ